MEELRSRLFHGGLEVLYSGSIQKMSNWGKWNNRNVCLTKSRDSRYEISYNKDKSPLSVSTVRLSSRSTVQSMEKDGLVFQVVPEPAATPYKFKVQNRKERLVWVKKLKEILMSLRGLSSPGKVKPPTTPTNLSITVLGGMSSADEMGSPMSSLQSVDGDSHLVTPRMTSLADAEQDRKRGWSLDQLVEEIKKQKMGKRRKKMVLKDHYLNGVCYKNSFQGKKIVEWLIRNGFEKNRVDAVKLVQTMCDRGMVNHVEQIGRSFEDSAELFVFTEDHMLKLQNLKKLMKRMHYHVEELDLQIHQLENNQDSTWTRARRIDREAGDMQFESMCTICILALGLLFQGFQDYTLSISGVIGLVVFSIYGKRLLRLYLSNKRRGRSLSVGHLPSISSSGSPRNSTPLNTPSRNNKKVWNKSQDEMTDLKRARGLTRQMSKRFEDDDEDDEEKTDETFLHSIDTSVSKERTLWLPYDEENGVFSDCWSQPDASKFKVRGVTYLTDGIKVNSARSAFQCLSIHLCRVKTKIDNVAERTNQLTKLVSALEQQQGSSSKRTEHINRDYPEYFVIQFQVPGYSMTQYFKMRDDAVKDSVFMSLYRKFCSGDDDFRNSRIKIIPNMVSGGGYMVKRMVGNKPALLARKIATEWYRGRNYIEMDIDISSSYAAGMILSAVIGVTKKLTLDLAFTIQGNSEMELPERILGAARYHQPDLQSKPFIEGQE